jgi:hypothetical protein
MPMRAGAAPFRGHHLLAASQVLGTSAELDRQAGALRCEVTRFISTVRAA